MINIDNKQIKLQIWDTVRSKGGRGHLSFGVFCFLLARHLPHGSVGCPPPTPSPVSTASPLCHRTGRAGKLPLHHAQLLPRSCRSAFGVRHYAVRVLSVALALCSASPREAHGAKTAWDCGRPLNPFFLSPPPLFRSPLSSSVSAARPSTTSRPGWRTPDPTPTPTW